MFDFGWAEILIVGAIALFVIGPKDIPAIAYQIGKFFRRIKYMQYALTGQFDDFMSKAEAKESPKSEKEDLGDVDEEEADAQLLEMMPLPEENDSNRRDAEAQRYIVPFSEKYLDDAINTIRVCFEWYAQNGDLPARSLKASLDESIVDKHDDMKAMKNRQYWVFIDNERVVGITGLMEMDDDENTTDWVNWFCVHPDYRGKGIGKKLLKYLENISIERGKQFLKLWTSDSPNESGAQILYDKMGFNVTSKEKYSEGDSTVLIYREKPLPPCASAVQKEGRL